MMKSFTKLLFAGAFGVLALGLSAASASHSTYYHDNGAGFSVTISDSRYYDYAHYDRGRHYDRRDRGRRHGYRGRDGRVINREVFNTRFRARIVLIEEAVRTRRGPRLVCTVKARGPEAGYVSERRMRRIARNNCSRRAHIRVFA